MDFKQWLEDTGEVSNLINGDEYSSRGIRSKIVATDVVQPSNTDKPERKYGKYAIILRTIAKNTKNRKHQ